MSEQLVAQPQNEGELVELNGHLSGFEKNLVGTRKRVEDIYCYIQLMEDFGHSFDQEHMIHFWLLNVCPLEA